MTCAMGFISNYLAEKQLPCAPKMGVVRLKRSASGTRAAFGERTKSVLVDNKPSEFLFVPSFAASE